MNKILIKFFLIILTAAVVISCGGGGGGVGGGGGTEPGIDRLGVTGGVVSGFGSIFVNGVEYETDSAEFEIDDDSAGSSQDDLNVGDTVVVTFDPDVAGNVAQTVFSDDAVEGPIDSIDPAGTQLVVAGQTVFVDAATSFDDRIPTGSLAGLNVGDFIEVNGQFDSNGNIRATRIEPGSGEVEVHGFITALDTGDLTFFINDLFVDYSGATVDDNFPSGSISNGDFAEVKGPSPGPNATLMATEVEAEGFGLDAANGPNFDDFDEVEVEIEGFITSFTSSSDFDVSGFPVRTNSGTEYEGGGPGDLGLNVKVEVEGDLNANNVLIADKVDIRRANDLRITALVDEDPVGDTLMLLGVTVRVDALTRIEDKSDADLEPFSVADLNVNDYVEVRGGADPSGGTGILASQLEREDPPDVLGEDTELRGFVDSLVGPSFIIGGVTIDTNGQTIFSGGIGSVADIQVGDLVDVNGTEGPNNSILAEEVELQ